MIADSIVQPTRSEAQDRFDYVGAITRGIEAWSADILRADRRVFRYRGADLQFAVERTLYFMLVNDAAMFAAFRGSTSADGAHPDSIEASLLPYVLGRRSGDAARGAAAVSLRQWFRREWQGWERPYPLQGRSPVPVDGTVFLLVIQPKFVRFLHPVAEALGTRAVFLTLDDPDTEKFLAQLELPNVALRAGSVAPPAGVGMLERFNMLCGQYDLFRAFFAPLAGSTLVIPEGNAPINETAGLAAAATGVRTVCIQHGWSPVSHAGFRNLHFDRMLVWGQLFADLLSPVNPRQAFAVVGTPTALPAAPGADVPRSVRGIGFFLQKTGPLIDASDWSACLDLIGWAAATYPDIDILVRDHPSTGCLDPEELAIIGDHANIRFMSPARHSLADTLASCDIVVAAYSTTLLEAIAVGAIPVVFGASGMPCYYPDLATMGAGIEVKSLSAAKTSLSLLVEGASARASLRRRGEALRPHVFAATGEQAVRAIVENILPGR